jgi:hypothetical protein
MPVSTWAADGGNNALLTATPVSIKPGAVGTIVCSGVFFWNTNTTDVFIQVFDATPDKVTLGTTKPRFSWPVPGGSGPTNGAGWEEKFAADDEIEFNNAMTLAATTTPTGSSAPGTAVQATIYFKP